MIAAAVNVFVIEPTRYCVSGAASSPDSTSATPTAVCQMGSPSRSTAAAMLGWLATERFRDGHPTSLGAASGVVAGLVAITPSCSAVSPLGAIAIGALAGVLCALAVGLKFRLGYDDSLDVVGVHLVGGLWGTIAIGFFATDAAPAAVKGLFYGGGVDQLWRQVVGALAVLVTSFVLSYVIGLLLHRTMGFRISEEAEISGIDSAEHAETGYDLAGVGGGGFRPALGGAPGTTTTTTTTTTAATEVSA